MPYRPLGYRAVAPSRLLIPAAIHLVRTLSERKVLDFAIKEALTKAMNPRTEVRLTARDELLALRSDPNFQGVDDYKALSYLLYSMLAYGGFGDHRPVKPEYIVDPIMTVDEMIDEALGQFVEPKMPTSDKYPNGDKCKWEHFYGQILYTIQDLASIQRKRIEMLDHFQRYFGNILYQMYDGTVQYGSLGPWEKSCLAIYIYHSDEKYKLTGIGASGSKVPLRFPVARDTDPEINETIERLKKVCEVGNWTNYTKIMSSADPHDLVFVVAPVLKNLPIAAGRRTARGVYDELELRIVQDIEWGEAEQVAAFTNSLTYDGDVSNEYSTTGWRVPAHNLELMNVPILADYPNVELSFQAVSAERDRLVAAWMSTRRGRRVSDLDGATMDDLLFDIALKSKEEGAPRTAMLNIDSLSFVDLSHPTMRSREITGAFTSHNLNQIWERIYYLLDGMIMSADVDMTTFYVSQGNFGIKPALMEYMRVSRSYFARAKDERALGFISGRLNASRQAYADSMPLISMSHNVALYQRYFGSADLGFDLVEYLAATTGRQKHPNFNTPTKVQ